MSNITGAQQVKFCNERVRPAGDKLAQAYHRCVACSQQWTALGGGQTATGLMQSAIQDAANHVFDAYGFAYKTEKLWFLLGGASTFIASDGAQQVFDNGAGTAQDPSRAPLTGLSVNQLMSRIIEFQNWPLSATQSFTDAARASVAAMNTILQVCGDGPSPIVLADAANFINRCNELATNYQANSNQNLGFCLAVAVNPNS